MKKLAVLVSFIVIVLASIFGFNYFTLSKPMNEVIKSDVRNKTVNVSAHYQYYVNPSVLVFDVTKIELDNSSADVFRVFFNYAEKLKSKSFDKVILSSKGTPKFYISGKHFKQIGKEYNFQNPIYIVRTFPENVYHLDGRRAFEKWSGGLFGVTAKQMEDFNEMAKQWFINDALK